MVEPSDGPGAVFLVRVWFESAATGAGFRARITEAIDPRGPGRSVVLTDPTQVLSALDHWLHDVHTEHGVDPG